MKKLFIIFILICMSQFNADILGSEMAIELNDNTYDKDAYNSGLEVTTIYKILSPIPNGESHEWKRSVEFGIAPIEDGETVYEKMIVANSDDQGRYRIKLPPGKYWIGGKEKEIDFKAPLHIQEQIITVNPNSFTQVKLFEIGAAP